tara:strand:- start:159 stop:407 length:249 start_codon:yes stop_codon:yes gene_type:complete
MSSEAVASPVSPTERLKEPSVEAYLTGEGVAGYIIRTKTTEAAGILIDKTHCFLHPTGDVSTLALHSPPDKKAREWKSKLTH